MACNRSYSTLSTQATKTSHRGLLHTVVVYPGRDHLKHKNRTYSPEVVFACFKRAALSWYHRLRAISASSLGLSHLSSAYLTSLMSTCPSPSTSASLTRRLISESVSLAPNCRIILPSSLVSIAPDPSWSKNFFFVFSFFFYCHAMNCAPSLPPPRDKNNRRRAGRGLRKQEEKSGWAGT